MAYEIRARRQQDSDYVVLCPAQSEDQADELVSLFSELMPGWLVWWMKTCHKRLTF